MNQISKKPKKSYLFFIALSAALGGFLFGYDTAVISGTIGFVRDQFSLNTSLEGWFVSSALVGCILGVIIAGELSDRFGRKYSLLVSALLFSISAIGCTLSGSHSTLIIYRLIGGIGVGLASMISPLYISEVSPAKNRGQMVALYQLAITAGIVLAYFANSKLLNIVPFFSEQNLSDLFRLVFVDEVWRAMFGSETVPALLFFMAMLFAPESPRWLAAKGKKTNALAILSKINGEKDASLEIKSIHDSLNSVANISLGTLFQKKIRIALFAGIGLAVLSQFTGINAIIYYGPRIMEETGLKLNQALGGQIVIGIVNMLATVFAIMKIDQYGRKKLMLGGITGMFVSLIIVGILFLTSQTKGTLLLVFILTFITSFAIGYGSVIWVLLSEIYPTKIRGRAMSIAVLSLWTGTAIIGQVVPWMLETLSPSGTFLIFALCCIPVPFILKKLPETKGMTLENIEKYWFTEI